MGKGKRSKAKGNEYENRIAKVFSEWWGLTFRRTPASGGLDWPGDIILPEGAWQSKFPFCIECKNSQAWSLKNIFTGKGKIWEYWEQSMNETPAGYYPILIFTKNFHRDYFMMKKEDWDNLDSWVGCSEVVSIFIEVSSKKTSYNVIIGSFNELLAVDVGIFKDYLKDNGPNFGNRFYCNWHKAED